MKHTNIKHKWESTIILVYDSKEMIFPQKHILFMGVVVIYLGSNACHGNSIRNPIKLIVIQELPHRLVHYRFPILNYKFMKDNDLFGSLSTRQ